MTARDVLHLFKGVKRTGDGWTALCPAHQDERNSLSIGDGRNNRLLLHCHAGCSYEAICAAAGIERQSYTAKDARQIVAAYDYRDEQGAVLYQNVRFEPKGFQQRRPDGRGGYLWKLNGVRRFPYRFPELLTADPSSDIFLTEGEKDADNLARLGLTSSSFKNWRQEFSAYVAKRNVYLLCDHDASGIKQADDAARLIASHAKAVKIIDLFPDEPLPEKHGRDVSDWLDAGGTIEQLRAYAEQAREFSSITEDKKSDDAPLQIVNMASVEAEDVHWLWYPYIPLGKLTIIEGDPGLGKSWLTCALAAAVSCGRGLPNTEAFEPGNVLMLSAEDGLADTLRPRLDAVHADVSRVFALAEPLTFDTPGLIRLEAAIIEHKPLLVIIDPLFAFTGAKTDIHRANECRAISAPLAAIAERQECALLAVRHLGKSRGGGHALNAGIGSIDFAAAARSVLLVGADPDDPHKRGIVQIKNNLAPHGDAIGYTLESGQFYWTGTSTLTAGRILSLPSDEEEKGARNEAEEFLHEVLSRGARPSKEIKAEARQAGISEITLRRAKDRLGIRAKKDGLEQWLWMLPEDAHSRVEDAQKTEHEHLQPNCTNKATYSNNLAEDAHVSEFEHLQRPDEHLQALDYPPDLDPDEFDARCAEIAESHRVSLREAAGIAIAEYKAASSM